MILKPQENEKMTRKEWKSLVHLQQRDRISIPGCLWQQDSQKRFLHSVLKLNENLGEGTESNRDVELCVTI